VPRRSGGAQCRVLSGNELGDPPKAYTAPAGGAGSEAQRRHYAAFLARTYGEALKLSPEHVGANLAVAEGLHMWGEHGPCPELGGRSAIDFYRAVLQLAPDNTNAATHAAYDGAVPEGGPAPQAGTFGEADAPPGESVAALIAPLPPPGASEAEVAAAADAALSLWRRNGVVVFEKLLTPHATEALLSAVRAAEADDGATDCYHTTHGTEPTLDSMLWRYGTRRHRLHPRHAQRQARHAQPQGAARERGERGARRGCAAHRPLPLGGAGRRRRSRADGVGLYGDATGRRGAGFPP